MPKKISPESLFNLTVRHERQDNSITNNSECIVALDYGEKFCGLAIASDGATVLPAAVVSTSELESALKSMVTTYGVKRLVVGLPLSSDGSENHICAQIRALTLKLKSQFTSVQISLVNERFSTQAVLSPDRNRIDDLAAMQILEFYLAKAKS